MLGDSHGAQAANPPASPTVMHERRRDVDDDAEIGDDEVRPPGEAAGDPSGDEVPGESSLPLGNEGDASSQQYLKHVSPHGLTGLGQRGQADSGVAMASALSPRAPPTSSSPTAHANLAERVRHSISSVEELSDGDVQHGGFQALQNVPTLLVQIHVS